MASRWAAVLQDPRPLPPRAGRGLLLELHALWRHEPSHERGPFKSADDIEVYSIDESFLDLSRYRTADRRALALDLKWTVRKWTGIPTCAGIGPTKTLAKVANAIAKKDAALAGVCDLSDPVERAYRVDRFDVADVWGVGRASTAKLHALGVRTAGDLTRLDPKLARSTIWSAPTMRPPR